MNFTRSLRSLRLRGTPLIFAAFAALGSTTIAAPAIVEPVEGLEGVYVARDDQGQWSLPGWTTGHGITHQSGSEYLAKKTLDLSAVPLEVWEKTKQIELSAFLVVKDYSQETTGKYNGLDEEFQIVVNGKAHVYRTDCGVPKMTSSRPEFAWYDFTLPKEELVRGRNEIVIGKLQSPKKENDDYLYLGIDNSVRRGNSAVSFNGGATWDQDKLTQPGGNGEYMVRLYLYTSTPVIHGAWHPGQTPSLDDPAHFVGYAGARTASATAAGLALAEGQAARMEWDAERIKEGQPVKVVAEFTGGEGAIQWVEANVRRRKITGPSPLTVVLEAAPSPYGVEITPTGANILLKSVTVEAVSAHQPRWPRVDMAPKVAAPRGAAVRRAPSSRVDGEVVRLANAGMHVEFRRGERLALSSLWNEFAQSEMLRVAGAADIFLVEAEGKRYSGSRDFRCVSLEPSATGFKATLRAEGVPLQAELSVAAEAEGLRLGLSVRNAGDKPMDIKVAFPHLSGLAVSDRPETDYYFFPWHGGVIADAPAHIRKGYGDYLALHQIVDLFSPDCGAGLYVRGDDADGRYKVLALRKVVPGKAGADESEYLSGATPEFTWAQSSLDELNGTGIAFEYMRQTCAPGASFAPADALLCAHPGDWHTSMKAYADWAHRIWQFRPYPSALENVVNQWCTGYREGVMLFDGTKYRTDREIVPPLTDLLELWCWWEWSDMAPWRTPMDKAEEKFGKTPWAAMRGSFAMDPVAKKLMYMMDRGDYDGYNARWGGLPAFQKAIQAYKDMRLKVLLYTSPEIVCDNTKFGQARGKEYGLVDAQGKNVTMYDCWRMCMDVPEYREFVANMAQRVVRETQADAIRFDETGTYGWTCFSHDHRHTFAAPGCNEWGRSEAELCKLTRRKLDEVNPKCVLMTESAGYDFMMQFLDGAIGYDIDRNVSSNQNAPVLRPVSCVTQRFYFPECRLYESVINLKTDPQFKKRLWNAVGTYGWGAPPVDVYPKGMYDILHENSDAFGSRNCEPLIPTLAARVYANRFTEGSKTVYTLINASGYTFDGPILSLPMGGDEHLVDLLNLCPCDVRKNGAEAQLCIYFPNDDVACIARLPRRISVEAAPDGLVVHLNAPDPSGRVVVLDAAGTELLAVAATGDKVAIRKADLPAGATPAVVKYLRGRLLADMDFVAAAKRP